MQEHLRRQGEEGGGQKSSKFWPNKKHVEPKFSSDPQYKQIFDTKGRKHYNPGQGQQPEWKPSVQQVDFDQIHEVKRPSAKGLVNKGILPPSNPSSNN